MSPKALWKMLMEVYHDWSDDKASRLAAALAFYTILSLAPTLVIIIAIAGFAFDELSVREEIVYSMHSLVGRGGASAIEMVMEHATMPGHSTIAETAGLIVLIFGAAEVFIQLKDSLNDIWDVKSRPDRGILGAIRGIFLLFQHGGGHRVFAAGVPGGQCRLIGLWNLHRCTSAG